jgi:hypothetical protein
MSSSAQRRFPVHRLPGDRAIARARARLLRRYRVRGFEADDLVAEAMTAVLNIPDERIGDPDGLFLRIVERRAQDFIARRRCEAVMERLLAAAPADGVDPAERAADVHLRAATLRRMRIRGVSMTRLIALFLSIARGTPAEEAFRLRKIPPGSRSRYLAALRDLQGLFDRLEKAARKKREIPRSFSPPSRDL